VHRAAALAIRRDRVCDRGTRARTEARTLAREAKEKTRGSGGGVVVSGEGAAAHEGGHATEFRGAISFRRRGHLGEGEPAGEFGERTRGN